jgi:hypothetical protein
MIIDVIRYYAGAVDKVPSATTVPGGARWR